MTQEAYARLLTALASRNKSDSASATQELLAQLGESDPRAALLTNFFAQRRAAEEEAQREQEQSAWSGADSSMVTATDQSSAFETAGVAVVGPERMQALVRLRQIVEGMYEELAALRTRNDELAAALGACPFCWGQDPDCHDCGGRGRSGSLLPERALFEQLVMPAVRRYKAREAWLRSDRAANGHSTNDKASPPIKGESR